MRIVNDNDWTGIPGRLMGAGFSVCYDRISYDASHPLWSAKAVRGGREWRTMGETLSAAFLELERQALDATEDWRKLIAHEVLRSA